MRIVPVDDRHAIRFVSWSETSFKGYLLFDGFDIGSFEKLDLDENVYFSSSIVRNVLNEIGLAAARNAGEKLTVGERKEAFRAVLFFAEVRAYVKSMRTTTVEDVMRATTLLREMSRGAEAE